MMPYLEVSFLFSGAALASDRTFDLSGFYDSGTSWVVK
jgi:hypothetical protein